MGLLDNKTALISGATRGIGRGIAVKFAQEGANVAFTYHSSVEKAQALEEELKGYGVEAKGYQSDAADFEAAESLCKDVISTFGAIDILVNNAGITRDTLIVRMSEKQWNEVIQTNLNSVFNLTKNSIRSMMKTRKGSIINITSIVGMRGNAGQSNYAASKAGIIGFSKSIAQELGSRNIRCNAVAPGFIATEMTDELKDEVRDAYLKSIPLKRFGSVEEVADVCLFLASDMSNYVSGQTISVCGAMNC
ncbi:MAG: 3-oxoacyl-[acyl-carrier-protein] reductase [Chitinophagales bacterium]